MQERYGVQYETVSSTYFEQRQLRKSVGVVLLWSLGVGAVISGDYFGWNFGLTAGGVVGLGIATGLMAIMYICMVYCVAELSTAMPHAGGFYAYTRAAFGPWGGFLQGVLDTIEYVLTPAVIVVGIGQYLDALFPGVPPYAWWIGAYTISIGINILDTKLTLRVGLVLTMLAMLVLAAFYTGALTTGAFRWEALFTIAPTAGHSTILPNGWYGVFMAIPYAIWFFLAIEEVPLASEEASDVARDMPRALIYGIATLLVLAFCTLVLNAGIGPGAEAIGRSQAPLIDGFQAILGTGATTRVLSLIALSGLAASFHTIIYAYGRVLFSLSRAGYYPRWISFTGSDTRTPHYALIVGGIIGLSAAWIIAIFGSSAVGAVLLNMAVFAAVGSYIGVMISYIKIKRDRPTMERPYTSPLGIPGAVVGTALAVLSLLATLAVPDYRPGVIGVIVVIAIALIYFAIYSSKHLVAQAPEELGALSLEYRIAELQSALSTIQAAKSKIEQVLIARADAVRAVVHDLNHTVQAVQAALDLWVMDLQAARVQQELVTTGHQRLQAALDQQRNLLHDMRDAALLEQGNLVLHPQPTDIQRLLLQVADQLAPSFTLADCRLTLNIPGSLPLIWCDARRIRRVITNVIENALQYTSSFRCDGLVEVSLRQEADEIVCQVSDNGCGIAPHNLKRLGSKFTRLAKGEQDSEGMGLGLNFCIGVLRLSSGSLDITSPGEGQGTTVTIRLSIAAPEVVCEQVTDHALA